MVEGPPVEGDRPLFSTALSVDESAGRSAVGEGAGEEESEGTGRCTSVAAPGSDAGMSGVGLRSRQVSG